MNMMARGNPLFKAMTPGERATTITLGLWTLLMLAVLILLSVRATTMMYPGDIGIGFGVGAGSWGGPYGGLGIGFGSGRGGFYGGGPYYGGYYNTYIPYTRYQYPRPVQTPYYVEQPVSMPTPDTVYYQDVHGNVWTSRNGRYTMY